MCDFRIDDADLVIADVDIRDNLVNRRNEHTGRTYFAHATDFDAVVHH
ncbi:MAG TPA: hypothetical protein VK148_03970 [Xanthobacteraceae bacterium]|nr:hypothetical protein [Xanthobacteraceae bacterium]